MADDQADSGAAREHVHETTVWTPSQWILNQTVNMRRDFVWLTAVFRKDPSL